MAKKKIAVSEVRSLTGAVAARAEALKPKRVTTTKHSKAKSAPIAVEHVTEEETPLMNDKPLVLLSVPEEIALVAYLYSEARGFHGGSQEEDWLRAEQEVRRRRT